MVGDELDRFKDFKALINGDIHKIDTIKCNDRYCVNICSVGLDARVGTDVHKYSRLPLCHGAFGYVVSLIVNIFKGLSSKMYVRNNDKLYSGQMTLVCACNGRFYGGGFNPVPEAKIDDGKMDVLVISKVPALKLAPLLLKYAKGKYKEVKRYVTHLETFKVEITAEKEFVVNVDGEAMRTEKVIFELIPKSLNLITPKNMKFWN